MLTMELDGDLGAFDARLRAAADVLDIPDDLLDDAAVSPLPERTAGRKWARTPILFHQRYKRDEVQIALGTQPVR